MVDRSALTTIILEKKLAKKLTWRAIAAEIAPGASPLFITAALLGQMTLTEAQAALAANLLGLSPDQPDPKGDRVKITMSGKFLPYRRY